MLNETQNPLVTGLMMFPDEESEKLTIHELLAISITTFYFVIGFPSNLLLIVYFVVKRMKFVFRRTSTAKGMQNMTEYGRRIDVSRRASQVQSSIKNLEGNFGIYSGFTLLQINQNDFKNLLRTIWDHVKKSGRFFNLLKCSITMLDLLVPV